MAAVTVSLRDFLAMAYIPKLNDYFKFDPRDGLLPLFLVEHEGREEWFYSEKERLEYFASHNLPVYTELATQSNSAPDLAEYGNTVRGGCYGHSSSLKPLCA